MCQISAENRNTVTAISSGLGVTVIPAPDYKPPKGHPCEGCVFTLKTDVPTCMTGRYPDVENCPFSNKRNIKKG